MLLEILLIMMMMRVLKGKGLEGERGFFVSHLEEGMIDILKTTFPEP